MALTIAVARRGQQRSLVRTFQPLRVATARSPTARILAWCAVDGLLAAGQSGPVAAAFERRADAAAGALVCLVGEGHDVRAAQRVDQAVGAGGGQVVHGAGQCG